MKFLKLVLMCVCMAALCDLEGTASAAAGDEMFQKASQQYQAKSYAESIKSFEAALALGLEKEQTEQAYTITGNAYMELGSYEKAIASHKKALDLNPNYHKAWVNLGIVYRLSGNLDEAEKCYLKAISISPDYPELHASLGALYIFKNDPKKAIEALGQAIRLDPQLAVAHANISLAYALAGRFDEAKASLDRAVVLGYADAATIRVRIDELRKNAGK